MLFRGHLFTKIAFTNLAEITVCINSCGMSIAPPELKRIISDFLNRFQFILPGNKNGQQYRFFPIFGFHFACGARTIQTQHLQGMFPFVSVIPVQNEFGRRYLFDGSRYHRMFRCECNINPGTVPEHIEHIFPRAAGE